MGIEKEINLETLTELNTLDFVQKTDSESMFGDLDSIKDRIIKDFDNIYLLDVNPQDIDRYKNNKDIYDILKHYKNNNAAEYKNLQLMFFQINQDGLDKMEKLYIEMKPKYGDILIRNQSKYYMIVGYFGGTLGRTNQYVIDQVKQQFDIISIKGL